MRSKLLFPVLAILPWLLAPGCASSGRSSSAAALDSPAPPDDFWLSVTVLRAPADTSSRAAAYLRAAPALRPARYIVEADRILRVAVGSGATEETFPPETRRLTSSEMTSLWSRLRAGSLVADDHPRRVGRPPAASAIGGETWYIVSFNAAGDQRRLAMRADPTPDPEASDAAALVEQLAALAWMK